ncbi:MAG TPA: hypothetical protein VNK26_05605 [Pyrinomonadaceae bacterium]|jgi:succinate dehydrogenase / fumarate reductase cytochrome b subunit|nr:hypothetical protein [Pyrinomonadaceae bacterium]
MAIKYSKTFILRKLHQISGIVPLGIFFFFHMFTNAKALNGEAVFEKAVQEIHDMPMLLLIEIFGIFIPLIFHSVYGIIISAESRPNVFKYSFARNWLYLIQRISGVFLFIFITFHVLNLRFGMIPGLNTTPVSGHANLAFDIISREFSSPLILAFYILGVAATSWHLAYGLWLFAVDWGIVIGEKAQKASLYASIAVAVALFGLGLNAAVAFVRPCGLMPQSFCSAEATETLKDKAPIRTF